MAHCNRYNNALTLASFPFSDVRYALRCLLRKSRQNRKVDFHSSVLLLITFASGTLQQRSLHGWLAIETTLTPVCMPLALINAESVLLQQLEHLNSPESS
jgi:hypothetical protein